MSVILMFFNEWLASREEAEEAKEES